MNNYSLDEFDEFKEEEKADINNLKSLAIPWYRRWLLKIAPKLFMKLSACDLGLEGKEMDLAYKLFGNAKRIDIQPLAGIDGRGFIVFIDKKLSLWFFQDGDHFVFDGVEMGEYGNGDVTVFDRLK